jgi:hypothetical protein
MGLMAMARRMPPRLAAGAFILNSGLNKWSADEETAQRLHSMATGTYPFLASLKPKDFARLLSVAEISLGTALLLPVIPAGLAGAGLTGFSAALLNMYLNTPGLTRENSVRPSPQGTAMAKDVWMFGIGLGLLIDDLTTRPGRRKARRRPRPRPGGRQAARK